MGEEAAQTVTVDSDPSTENPDPMVFSVGEEEPAPAETKTETPPAADTEDIKKALEEVKAQNEKLQREVNRKWYQRRKEREAEQKAEGADGKKTPPLTDAQLLKIMEEHKDEPAVLLQVFKHVSEATGEKIKKETTEDASILQEKAQAEAFLKQNMPGLFDEESDTRQKVDEARGKLRLNDHPLGDFLAVAAARMVAYPEMIRQAREDERKKVLAEMAEGTRKSGVKNAAPAATGTAAAKSGGNDADYIAQGKAMNLSGEALKLYVQMRKNARNQRQVMEA